MYSPWPLINLESGSTYPRVTVRDLAGVPGHLSGPMGAPSDRKEPGTDPVILHSGPTCCMYMQLHSDLHAWVQKRQYLGTQSTLKVPVFSAIDKKHVFE